MKRLVAPIAAMVVVGAAGTGLIKQSEGTRYRSYLDDAGIPTICTGHTGPEVKLGQTATQEECDKLLKQDLMRHSAAVNRCVNYPLTQYQYDAVVSLTFNIGEGALCRSTLARKINSGDLKGAAEEFPRWNKVKVKGVVTVSRGLTARREREKALFEGRYPK
ncbi:SAR endolysin [Caulobacter phage DCM]|uniref:Lysozyme n=1 Tax=Caulobacter phage DCM TaxID=3020391 RepID=A0AAE9WWZ9_9CAUD|nr:SAR endolysin [Caulobacter phage DCM]WCD56135.1 SAR endolysin [Caulobacter phage BL199]